MGEEVKKEEKPSDKGLVVEIKKANKWIEKERRKKKHLRREGKTSKPFPKSN